MLTLDSETPSDGTWRFLWCWLSFCCSFLFRFQATLPCHRHSTLASQAREGLHQLWALPQLLLIAFCFHLPRALRFWVGIFYPQAFFTLRFFATFLAQPTFIKASLGVGSSSLKFAGLHTDPGNADPTHLFVWFTVIHNPLCILNLYLYMSILQSFTCGENFEKKFFFDFQFLIE